ARDGPGYAGATRRVREWGRRIPPRAHWNSRRAKCLRRHTARRRATVDRNHARQGARCDRRTARRDDAFSRSALEGARRVVAAAFHSGRPKWARVLTLRWLSRLAGAATRPGSRGARKGSASRGIQAVKILLSWSSGKDSAWTLHVLNRQYPGAVGALLTTVN